MNLHAPVLWRCMGIPQEEIPMSQVPVLDETRQFYVSVIRGRGPETQARYLLGPYETHQEALDARTLGKALADSVDPIHAWEYAYGTCSSPREKPLPVLFRPGKEPETWELPDGQIVPTPGGIAGGFVFKQYQPAKGGTS